MLPRRTGPFLACAAVFLGCGEPPEPQAPLSPAEGSMGPTVPVPSVTAAETAAPKAPTPVLAPLATDARPPCDVAAIERKEAELLHGQGRSYKALRKIEKADGRCPSTAPASWATKVDALSKLGRDTAAQALAKDILAASSPDPAAATAARAALAKTAPGSPPAADTLLTQALSAQKNGAADARAQLDRAVVRFEQETSESPKPFFDIGPRSVLALSKDGATAVLAADGMALLVDTKDLKPRRILDVSKTPEDASISADGKQIAVSERGGETSLFSTVTGKKLKRLSWAGEEAGPSVFSPDGKRLIVAGHTSWDTAVRIWNLDTGDSADSFTIAQAGDPTDVALSRDGKTLAVGTHRGFLEVWSLSPKKKLATLAKKDSFVEHVASLAFSPKGDRLAALFGDGKIGVWDSKSGKSLWTAETETGFSHPGVGFSSDGTRLLAGSYHGFSPGLREWDATSGAELQNKPLAVVLSRFSEDGKIGVGADRNETFVHDLATGTTTSIPTADPGLGALAFGPPRTLAIAMHGAKAFHVITPEATRTFESDTDSGPISISADGRAVARSSWRAVEVFDVEKDTRISGYPALPESSPAVYFGAQGAELRLLYHAYSARSDEVKLFSASPGAAAWKERFATDRKGFDDLLLSEYGESVAGRSDRRVYLLDPASGVKRTVDDDPKERPDSIALSADGRALFVLRKESLARFDTATGKATHSWIPVGCWANRIAPSFEGTRAALQCSDKLRLFSFPKDSESATVTSLDLGHFKYEAFALAPHGDLIVTSDDLGRLTIWDDKGNRRAEIIAFTGIDAVVASSPAGRVSNAGQDRSKIDDRFHCRVGAMVLPFVACEDALTDDDLFRDAFAPSKPSP